MRIIIILLVCSQSLFVFSQGQVEMNDIAHKNWSQSQKIKDSLVVELLKINKNDSTFIKTFEASEKLWNTFVEEQFNLKFPAYESWGTRREQYGSQFDMLNFNFMKSYCDLRIATLYDLFEE
ncbi:hypothetical protein [Winogradskyella sp. UBA3174]|uniref:hypothetical protein n=1 Tax=Winogradskyella sp. UBA3174 TaxID=1947785 RepID=UPI0025E03E85|nr:hypothetical protein [Winogradskyella sp. UBA3174]|tara:strand:- start:10514 stop:10879 length:366 start_codon:yes stop_codon:yes gene_type:complete